MRPLICEPFTNMPMKIDIDKLTMEAKPEEKKRVEAQVKTARDFLNMPVGLYDVIPIFTRGLDHLMPKLSTRKDPYLRCMYRQFLNNVPCNFGTIKLHNVTRMPKPRRWNLNGNLYSTDFKLAPIPADRTLR